MLALQLVNGRPQALLEGGSGPIKLKVNSSLSDGLWHSLHLSLDTQVREREREKERERERERESVCVCVCVACLSLSQPFPYGASSEVVDRSSGRAETTSHTTHRDSEATTPRLTSRTYLLLLGEQGLDTH